MSLDASPIVAAPVLWCCGGAGLFSANEQPTLPNKSNPLPVVSTLLVRAPAPLASGRSVCQGRVRSGCCLTLRSRRGPTASHQARATGTGCIIRGPGLASCRRSRLTSNVRPHKPLPHTPRNMRHHFIAIAFATALAGCAQTQPKPVARPIGPYVPPSFDASTTARLSGSISSLLLTKTRARVESVDLLGVRIAPEGEQPPVTISAGKRTLIVVCETDMATAIDRTDVAVELIAGHEYRLTCKAANLWSHTGSDFELIDLTGGNKVVATAFAPGRAYPPRGRLF